MQPPGLFVQERMRGQQHAIERTPRSERRESTRIATLDVPDFRWGKPIRNKCWGNRNQVDKIWGRHGPGGTRRAIREKHYDARKMEEPGLLSLHQTSSLGVGGGHVVQDGEHDIILGRGRRREQRTIDRPVHKSKQRRRRGATGVPPLQRLRKGRQWNGYGLDVVAPRQPMLNRTISQNNILQLDYQTLEEI